MFPHKEAQMTHALRRGLSLLLVEDDTELAEVMARWAAWVGATMDTAGLGSIALALAAAKTYDAVLLDLSLPDMDGERLYARLVGLRPALASRVIILTGGAVGQASQAFLYRTRCPVVLKPFDLESLARQIARLEFAAA
jgi:two-component system OmpR family response regulator